MHALDGVNHRTLDPESREVQGDGGGSLKKHEELRMGEEPFYQ